jgi:hypothetical protein
VYPGANRKRNSSLNPARSLCFACSRGSRFLTCGDSTTILANLSEVEQAIVMAAKNQPDAGDLLR